MATLIDYMPIYVYTQRGLLELKNILPGDSVYEYGSNKMLTVLDVLCQVNPGRIREVKYTDGRSQIFQLTDWVLTGSNINRLVCAIQSGEFGTIKTYPIEFDQGVPKDRLYPDPYIAGALIIHGRYDTSYINLPLDRSAADQLFAHKYNLDFADKLEANTTFYAWNGGDKTNPITWDEFFPNYDFYMTSKKVTSPIIPKEYFFSSVNNRWKFIRGVFDIGYNKVMFPDSVGIAHWSEDRLQAVQTILWSLGILSKISYDPHLPLSRGRNNRLDIMGSYDGYPGFFYNIDSIRHNLRNDHELYKHINPLQMRIESVNQVNINGAIIEKALMSNIVLEKDNALYVTENFLPRVSL